jgi:hypothetical protein
MMYSRLVLLTTTVASLLLLLSLSCVDGARKFDFPRGSAKSRLGVSKLARIQNRSKQHHMTVDELANLIEQDSDLVSALNATILSVYPICCWLHGSYASCKHKLPGCKLIPSRIRCSPLRAFDIFCSA